MKNILLLACVIALTLIGSVGCSKSPNGWYPIEGGYINLKNVKTITTHAELQVHGNGEVHFTTVIDGSITRDKIEKAKDVIREKCKKGVKWIHEAAYIEFDEFKVKLDSLSEFQSFKDITYKDIINLLDSWLESVEELELPKK